MELTYKKLVEYYEIEEENDLILEYANMPPKLHGFGINVKLHLMQPSIQLKHGPRVKIFKQGSLDNFCITLEEIPRVVGNYKSVVSTSELNILISKIKKYRTAMLKFWDDPQMDILELEELFKRIDKGDHV